MKGRRWIWAILPVAAIGLALALGYVSTYLEVKRLTDKLNTVGIVGSSVGIAKRRLEELGLHLDEANLNPDGIYYLYPGSASWTLWPPGPTRIEIEVLAKSGVVQSVRVERVGELP